MYARHHFYFLGSEPSGMGARCPTRRAPTVAEGAQITPVLKRCFRAINYPDRCRLYVTSKVRLV